MQSQIVKLVLFILTIFVMTLKGRAAHASERWVVATLDWPPYVCSTCPRNGAAADALRKLLEKKGISIEFIFYPWVQAQKNGGKPSYVGYFPAWTNEVLPNFYPSEPLFSSPVIFVQRKAKPLKWQRLEDLTGKKFAVTEGYGNTDEFNKLIKNKKIKVVIVLGEEATLMRLSQGVVDGVLMDYRVAQYYLKVNSSKYAGALEINPKIVEMKDLHFAFNSNNRDKLDILRKAVEKSNFSKAVDEYLVRH